jgi:hypothetical protein
LTAIKAGDGSVIGTLALGMPGGDIELIRQEQKINLQLIVHLGSGIPLLDAIPEPVPVDGEVAAADGG